jgi:hypothetical protein
MWNHVISQRCKNISEEPASETSVTFYQTTRRHIPETHNLIIPPLSNSSSWGVNRGTTLTLPYHGTWTTLQIIVQHKLRIRVIADRFKSKSNRPTSSLQIQTQNFIKINLLVFNKKHTDRNHLPMVCLLRKTPEEWKSVDLIHLLRTGNCEYGTESFNSIKGSKFLE